MAKMVYKCESCKKTFGKYDSRYFHEHTLVCPPCHKILHSFINQDKLIIEKISRYDILDFD